MATVGLKGLLHGHDHRDQPSVSDAVHVTLGCMSEIMILFSTLLLLCKQPTYINEN